MSIIISSDTSCDLSKEQIKNNEIKIIPIYINLDGEEYKDGIDISSEEILKYVKENKKLPKTAAVGVLEYKEYFESILKDNPDSKIIHIGLGGKISSSTAHAIEAASELDGKVLVIDSNNLSTGVGLLVLYASKLAKEGLDAETIKTKVEQRVSKVQASFIIQEVNFLYKGGRCNALQLLGANILKIKPKIQVIDGEMKNNGKPRGKIDFVLKQYVDETLNEYNNPDKTICFVTHSPTDSELVNEIVEYVKSKNIFDEVVETTASGTITSHCGQGTLGILYINDGENA